MAASAEPMAKVRVMVWLTLMPISSAAPRSSDTARMALPRLVWPVKSVRPTMMSMLASMVTMVVPEMRRFSAMTMSPKFGVMAIFSGVVRPRATAAFSMSVSTSMGKLLGLAVQISCATFCRR